MLGINLAMMIALWKGYLELKQLQHRIARPERERPAVLPGPERPAVVLAPISSGPRMACPNCRETYPVGTEHCPVCRVLLFED